MHIQLKERSVFEDEDTKKAPEVVGRAVIPSANKQGGFTVTRFLNQQSRKLLRKGLRLFVVASLLAVLFSIGTVIFPSNQSIVHAAPADCNRVVSQNETAFYLLDLWKNDCTGGYWAGIAATGSGTFTVQLYEDGILLSSNTSYLNPGGVIVTGTYYGYGSFSAYGTVS